MVGCMAEQHRLATFLEQPGRMRSPGVQAQGLGQAAHHQAAVRGAGPDRLQFGSRRKSGAQPHLEGDAGNLARAQVGDGLLHALHPPGQAVERRVDGLHHRGGQRHVGFDQRGDGLLVDVLVGQQQRQLDQRVGLGRDVDLQRAQLRVDGHGRGRPPDAAGRWAGQAHSLAVRPGPEPTIRPGTAALFGGWAHGRRAPKKNARRKPGAGELEIAGWRYFVVLRPVSHRPVVVLSMSPRSPGPCGATLASRKHQVGAM